jgi:hypothetical protein
MVEEVAAGDVRPTALNVVLELNPTSSIVL